MIYIDKKIIYWLTFIISTLIISAIIGLVGMYGTLNIIAEKSETNEKRLAEIIVYHNHDVDLMRDNIRDIKSDQEIIKEDVKKILSRVR